MCFKAGHGLCASENYLRNFYRASRELHFHRFLIHIHNPAVSNKMKLSLRACLAPSSAGSKLFKVSSWHVLNSIPLVTYSSLLQMICLPFTGWSLMERQANKYNSVSNVGRQWQGTLYFLMELLLGSMILYTISSAVIHTTPENVRTYILVNDNYTIPNWCRGMKN